MVLLVRPSAAGKHEKERVIASCSVTNTFFYSFPIPQNKRFLISAAPGDAAEGGGGRLSPLGDAQQDGGWRCPVATPSPSGCPWEQSKSPRAWGRCAHPPPSHLLYRRHPSAQPGGWAAGSQVFLVGPEGAAGLSPGPLLLRAPHQIAAFSAPQRGPALPPELSQPATKVVFWASKPCVEMALCRILQGSCSSRHVQGLKNYLPLPGWPLNVFVDSSQGVSCLAVLRFW